MNIWCCLSFYRKKILESPRVFSAWQYPGNVYHPLTRTSGTGGGSGVASTTWRCYFGAILMKLKISFKMWKFSKIMHSRYLAGNEHQNSDRPWKSHNINRPSADGPILGDTEWENSSISASFPDFHQEIDRNTYILDVRQHENFEWFLFLQSLRPCSDHAISVLNST